MNKLETKIIFLEKNEELIEKFVKKFSISHLVANILVNRGIDNIKDADMFLNGTLKDLHSPFLMHDMEKAVDRLKIAMENNESVGIFGDYDVDGTTGTALLYHVLKKIGLRVFYSIPDRIDEGYGLSVKNIDIAKKENVSLLISIDCGISNIEEVEYANSLGIDVIITDHHEPTGKLPKAHAILNPKKENCNYPFKMLSGVGVAYKLVNAMELRGFNIVAENYLDLNALGTIADITPLVDENRIIAKYGLRKMQDSSNYGIQALLELTGIDTSNVSTTHIGYYLAPRINASGRIGNAENSLKLFLSKSRAEAMKYAQILDNDNKRRQKLEKTIIEDVEEEISKLNKDMCITLASDRWHAGIIGIVASKIKDKYYKPTVLISIDDNNNCRGSARSISQFSLIDALTDLGDLLIQYGGHKLAAGFSVEYSKIDEFRKELNRLTSERLTEEDRQPTIKVDCMLNFSDISKDLINELEILSPFGHKNPRPLFMTKDASITEHRKVGIKSNHLLFRAKKSNIIIDGIGFNKAEFHEKISSPAQSIDLVYELNLNTFANQERVQLKLRDMKFPKIQYFKMDNNHREALALKEKGNEMYRAKKFDLALSFYQAALELKNDEPELYFNMGLIHKQKGNFSLAKENLMKAIYNSPDDDRGSKIITKAEIIINRMKN